MSPVAYAAAKRDASGFSASRAARPDGIGCFGASSQAFLASLAPLLAFPLVGTAIGLFTDGVMSCSD